MNASPAPSATPSYCLGVTDIEPTQYGPVFERFLNPQPRAGTLAVGDGREGPRSPYPYP